LAEAGGGTLLLGSYSLLYCPDDLPPPTDGEEKGEEEGLLVFEAA
jgi:hypothetical protein